MKVIVVGGVAGGASAAARLRRIDENAEIIVFERGKYISFTNCGLPYYIGGIIEEKEKLFVQSPEKMRNRFNIDVRIFHEVTGINREKKQIEVYDIKNKYHFIESYDKLILAPGAAPIKPPVKGFDAPNVFTLRDIPDTAGIKEFIEKHKPDSAVVVGAGYIGMELVENLHHRGIAVSIIELTEQVLAPLDPEMSAIIQCHIKDKKIKLYLHDSVKEVQHQHNHSIVELHGGKKIDTDLILIGIGVRPEIPLAQKAGLDIGKRGGIKVDEYLKTSDPNIYAVGDAIEVSDYINKQPSLIPLAGPANKQGRIAANNICGIKEKYHGTQGTSILKIFELVAASTGNNEKLLKRFSIPFKKSYIHEDSHSGYYPGSETLSIKLLFSPDDGKILGAQIIGREGVDKRIDVLATAIRAGMTVYDLEQLELAYAPPYSSAKDPVNIAGYVASNILKGNHKINHWEELISSDSQENILIDVRHAEEYKKGTIKNAINIPVDEIRNNLDRIPRDKKVILFCRQGVRGYIAYTILKQKGYHHVSNLSGGYKTYLPVIQSQSNAGIND